MMLEARERAAVAAALAGRVANLRALELPSLSVCIQEE